MGSHNEHKQHLGILYAFFAFLTWGLFPIFWKQLDSVSAIEIMAHRIFWSFVFAAIFVIISGKGKELKAVFKNRKLLMAAMLSSIFISTNWFIFIWAVNADHILETSLGYYINPLFMIFLGMIVLRERLNFWQLLALLFALIGVVVSTVQVGQIPWIALSLALSFSLYGLSKKLTKFEVSIGLFMETLFVMPIALFYILYLYFQGNGSFLTVSTSLDILFILSGIVTLLPLLWFAYATKYANLTTVGFIQYVTPTISLIIGVMLYNERFTTAHAISFGFIWFALLLYSFSHTHWLSRLQPRYFKRRSLVVRSSANALHEEVTECQS